jgi:hypothetical protein
VFLSLAAADRPQHLSLFKTFDLEKGRNDGKNDPAGGELRKVLDGS